MRLSKAATEVLQVMDGGGELTTDETGWWELFHPYGDTIEVSPACCRALARKGLIARSLGPIIRKRGGEQRRWWRWNVTDDGRKELRKGAV